MKTPILSIVIPTYKRPQFLQRAINSALQSAPDGDVEVIVVPNGPDESWKRIALSYTNDARVQWQPIVTAQANAARNHGLQLANGEYVRFLDDDDYLLDNAKKQCILLNASGHDVSQGGIDFINNDGFIFHSRNVYHTTDFLISILAPDIFTLPHSLLWRRKVIIERKWNTNLKFGQDVAFAFEIARDMEITTHQCEFQVGAWLHHKGERISRKADYSTHARAQVEILLDTIRGLERRSALTAQRREWLSTTLWRLIHSHFYLSPFFWTETAQRSLNIFPCSRPNEAAFKRFPLIHVNPLVIEWLLTPHRFIRHHVLEYIKRSDST